MSIYKERGRRAQRLASTRKLAGTLHSAAASIQNLTVFRPTLRAVKAGSKNW
jgi:hypothetical protein